MNDYMYQCEGLCNENYLNLFAKVVKNLNGKVIVLQRKLTEEIDVEKGILTRLLQEKWDLENTGDPEH